MEACCKKMFQLWLRGKARVAPTWTNLLEILTDCSMKTLADYIREALPVSILMCSRSIPINIPFLPSHLIKLHDIALAMSLWEIGSVWTETVGQSEVGGFTWRVNEAWPCLGSAIERPWFALGGLLLSFMLEMDLETSHLTLYSLHFQCSKPVLQLLEIDIPLHT